MIQPLGWLDKAFGWTVKHEVAFYAVLSGFFVGLGVWQWIDGNWSAGWLDIVLAFTWAFFIPMKRGWIQTGYRRGRLSMFEGMREAQKRGMSFEDWRDSEYARDIAHILGPTLAAQIQAKHRGGEDEQP